MDKAKIRKYLPFVLWSIVLIAADVLARCGVIPTWVFYTLLIVMHAWIFTKIGIKIYNRHNKHNNR